MVNVYLTSPHVRISRPGSILRAEPVHHFCRRHPCLDAPPAVRLEAVHDCFRVYAALRPERSFSRSRAVAELIPGARFEVLEEEHHQPFQEVSTSGTATSTPGRQVEARA